MAQTWESQNIDDILSSRSSAFARSIAMSYLGRLLDNLDPQSQVMAILCSHIEDPSNFPDARRDDFPAKRRTHAKRVKTHEAKMMPHDHAIRTLRAEREVLTKERPDAERGRAGEIRDRLNDIVGELERESTALAYLRLHRPKAYKPHYRPKLVEREHIWKNAYPTALKADVQYLHDFFRREARKRNRLIEHPVFKNLERLGDLFKWPALERDVVTLLWTMQNSDHLRKMLTDKFLSDSGDKAADFNHLVAVMMGAERRVISDILSPQSELFAAGILIPASGSKDDFLPKFSPSLLKMLDEPDMSLEKMLKSLIGEDVTTRLSLHQNFNYVSEHISHVSMLVNNAVKGRLQGQNILIYGMQDSGKTEFTKALAKELGIPLFMLAENKAGEEPTVQERLARVLLAKRLTAHMDNVILAVDEAEDLLKIRGDSKEKDAGGVSKIYLNRLLERGFMTIWIVNDIEAIHPAVRRRFKYSIPFGALTSRDRLQAWKDISATHKVALTENDLQSLADQYTVPVGSIVTAVENAALTTKDKAAITRSLRSTGEFVFGGIPAILSGSSPNVPYYPALANFKEVRTGHDAASFTKFVPEFMDKPVGVLAYGPIGCGKKALFKNLAQENGYEFLNYDFVQSLLDPDYLSDVIRVSVGKPVVIAWDGMAVLNPFPSHHAVAGMVKAHLNNLMQVMPCMQVFCSNDKSSPPDWLKHEFPMVLQYGYLSDDQIKKSWPLFFGHKEPKRTGAYKPLTPGYFSTIANRYRSLGVPDMGRINQELADVAQTAQETKPQTLESMPTTRPH